MGSSCRCLIYVDWVTPAHITYSPPTHCYLAFTLRFYAFTFYTRTTRLVDSPLSRLPRYVLTTTRRIWMDRFRILFCPTTRLFSPSLRLHGCLQLPTCLQDPHRQHHTGHCSVPGLTWLDGPVLTTTCYLDTTQHITFWDPTTHHTAPSCTAHHAFYLPLRVYVPHVAGLRAHRSRSGYTATFPYTRATRLPTPAVVYS